MANIFLYVPNIIGYIRIILLILALYYALSDFEKTIIFYLLSQFLDAFDGFAARLLNQSTMFGSMLDQLTDRVSSLCLIMTLGHLYPSYHLIFQLLVALDISSHWLHFFSSTVQGKTSHKSAHSETNILMRYYYGNKIILFTLCAAYELFFCSLYAYHFMQQSYYIELILMICAPFMAFKILINIIQMLCACKVIGQVEELRGSYSYINPKID